MSAVTSITATREMNPRALVKGLAASGPVQSGSDSIVDLTIEKRGPIAAVNPSPKTWDNLDYTARHDVFSSSFDPNAYKDANHYAEIYGETHYQGIHVPRLADNFAPYDTVTMVQNWKFGTGPHYLSFKYSEFSFQNSPPGRMLNVTL